MRIGIIGCGYVGSALARHFVQLDHHLIVTTRQSERVSKLNEIAHEVCLIQDSNDYLAFLKKLDVLFISVAPDSFNDYYSTYLGTAIQITDLLAECPDLQQIIYTSSTSVYGEHRGEWVDENSVCVPLNENTKILLETEKQLLNQMTRDLNICIFRLGEIIGPNRMIKDRLKSYPDKVYAGDGSQYTNLIHLNEIIQACELAVLKKLSGIYNLCNDYHLSRKELYEKICHRYDLPAVKWNKDLQSPHGGNKRIQNTKLKSLGMTFSDNNPL